MDHFSQIGVMEVFLEATPTTFLLIVMIVSAYKSHGEDGLIQLLMGNKGGWDLALFIISCASSIFSFAFGVSRYEYGTCLISIMSSSLFFLNESSLRSGVFDYYNISRTIWMIKSLKIVTYVLWLLTLLLHVLELHHVMQFWNFYLVFLSVS